MTDADILTLLQTDLGLLMLDNAKTNQLIQYINAARGYIRKEGVALAAPYSYEDTQLIEMYAAYLYRKRATGEAMPRMLRYALNNRLFGEKAENCPEANVREPPLPGRF